MATDTEQYLLRNFEAAEKTGRCNRARQPQALEGQDPGTGVIQAELDASTEAYFASDEWALELDSLADEADPFAADDWIEEMAPEVLERWQATPL